MTTDEINAEIGEEYKKVLAKYPGLAQATALDIACGIVAERNRTPAERQADGLRWLQEREEVMRDGRHPLWPR